MKQLLAVFTAAVIGTTGIVPAVAAADYEPGTEEVYYEEDSVYFEDPAEEDLTYFEEESFSEEDTEGAALPDSFAEGEEMTDEEEYAPEETEDSEIQYEEENDEIVGAVNQKASSDAEAPEIIDVIAEDSESVPEDAELVGEGELYVYMNIPYDKFYEGDGADGVDAVSSATLNKPRTGGLAGGSYHVSADGSDITGVIFPVKVASADVLAGFKQVTDADSVSITVTNRGQTSTQTYEGRDALFENESYAYYIMSEKPKYYKEMTVGADGSISFSRYIAEDGIPVRYGVTGTVTQGARHADIEIALENTDGIEKGAAVSGVILTTNDGVKYGLRHIANIWRATEIGWNLSDNDIAGKTITDILYITPDLIVRYPVSIPVRRSGYVLMNIPYADFYAAEGIEGVDAVSSATKNKPRTGTLAGGSYHVNADGTDITGITYPVKVASSAALKGLKEVTDADSVSITVTNRGTTSTTEYKGADALFENSSYAYYDLAEAPAVYKTLSLDEEGKMTFSAVSGGSAEYAGTAELLTGAETTRGDYQLNLSVEGFAPEKVYASVVKTAEGGLYALRHVQNIWRNLEIGFSTGHLVEDHHGCVLSWKPYEKAEGQTVNAVLFYTDDGIVTVNLENGIYLKPFASFSAKAVNAKTVSVTGLPEAMQDASVTVSYTIGEGREAVTTNIVENVQPGEDGAVGLSAELEEGREYQVTVKSSNYATVAATITYTKPVVLPRPVVTSAVSKNGKLVIKWKKCEGVDGYVVRYITGKTVRARTIKSAATVTYTTPKVKKGKTYRVAVAAYKRVGTKLQKSAWSKVKQVKAK